MESEEKVQTSPVAPVAPVESQETTPAPSAAPVEDMTIPQKRWTDKHYELLAKWVNDGVPGEEMMLRCKIQRREILKARVLDAQSKGMQVGPPKWNSDGQSGPRSLRPLTVAKDGSLRISPLHFARIGGTPVRQHDSFTLALTDGGYLLKHIPGKS